MGKKIDDSYINNYNTLNSTKLPTIKKTIIEKNKTPEENRKSIQKDFTPSENSNDNENNNDDNEECKSMKNDEVKNKKKKTTEFNLNSMDFLNELSRSVIQAEESETTQQRFGRRRRPYHF
jgi:hypothetical protein